MYQQKELGFFAGTKHVEVVYHIKIFSLQKSEMNLLNLALFF